MKLSSKHLRTLCAIFEDPVRSDIEWTGIENLLLALGAELSEGRGSRVRVYLRGVRAVFHRPHPQKETEKGAIRSMRRFLTEAGVQLEEQNPC
ncbi:MAG: type II toxin-antitoxin system HicA family toxin [Syntrophobacteraceae bacterium]